MIRILNPDSIRCKPYLGVALPDRCNFSLTDDFLGWSVTAVKLSAAAQAPGVHGLRLGARQG
jgi:hypothetical protein